MDRYTITTTLGGQADTADVGADDLERAITLALQITSGGHYTDAGMMLENLADRGRANYASDHGDSVDVFDTTRVPYVHGADGAYYGEKVDTFEMNALPGYYVADAFAATLRESIVAGPFASPAIAAADRARVNIAEDCNIVRIVQVAS